MSILIPNNEKIFPSQKMMSDKVKKFRIVMFLFSLLPLTFLYYPVLYKMTLDWWLDENYSHGFLIPLISGYIVFRNREELFKNIGEPSWWGIALVMFGIFFLIVGLLGAELFTTRLSFLITLSGIILTSFGRAFFKKIFFAIFIGIFMIPLPYMIYNSITLPLKIFATDLSSYIMSVFQIPVFQEGNIIHLPTLDLQVVEACSGIRSIISLITIGTIFAYFFQTSLFKRALLILISIPIAIFTNVFRITITGILSDLIGPEIAKSFYHLFSGWAIFFMGVLFLIGVNKILTLYTKEQTEPVRKILSNRLNKGFKN